MRTPSIVLCRDKRTTMTYGPSVNAAYWIIGGRLCEATLSTFRFQVMQCPRKKKGRTKADYVHAELRSKDGRLRVMLGKTGRKGVDGITRSYITSISPFFFFRLFPFRSDFRCASDAWSEYSKLQSSSSRPSSVTSHSNQCLGAKVNAFSLDDGLVSEGDGVFEPSSRD